MPGRSVTLRDRGLALARRAVARAGGEIDRGGGDRLGERLLVLARLGVGLRLLVLDRVGVGGLAAAKRIDSLGDDVHLQMRPRHGGLHARRGLLRVLLLVLAQGSLPPRLRPRQAWRLLGPATSAAPR